MKIKDIIIGFLLSSVISQSHTLTRRPSLKEHNILLLYLIHESREEGSGIWGSSVYRINIYKQLLKNGYRALMMTNNEHLQKEFNHFKIPYRTSSLLPRKISHQKKADRLREIAQEIIAVCKQQNTDLIHCNGSFEVKIAKIVKRTLPHIKIVLSLHVEQNYPAKLFNQVDGVIGVSPRIANYVRSLKKNHHLPIKKIWWIAPFFNQHKFLDFRPQFSKKDFFKKQFNVDIKDIPIISMVANFYQNEMWKNHPLLLHALQKLIYERKKLCQVVLAGSGPRMEQTKRLAKTLGVSDYVHFLGHTPHVPELLYHSDIKALTSRQEAISIALIEASLMKKPLVGTANTGMETIIKHNQTGLLFTNNNVHDLVNQLERLLTNKRLCERLGNNAFNFATEKLVEEVSFNKLERFYNQVLTNAQSHRHIHIVGERGSGTNFIAQLITKNIKGITVSGPAISDPHGWKHGFVDDEIINNNKKSIYLHVHRNPYTWVRSFHDKPWHAHPSLKKLSFSDFIKTTWKAKHKFNEIDLLHERDPETGNLFRNVMQLRTTKLKHFEALKNRVLHFYSVPYELVTHNPQDFLKTLTTHFSLEQKKNYKPILTHQDPKDKGAPFKKKQYPILNESDRQFINQELDWTFEKSLGYEMNKEKHKFDN